MLEYNLDDATELISNNIQLATSNMGQVDDDLDFLRYYLNINMCLLLLVFIFLKFTYWFLGINLQQLKLIWLGFTIGM